MWLNKKRLILIKSFFLFAFIISASLVWAQSDPSYNYGGFRRALNSGYNDLPRNIKIDSSGSIYITGYTWGASNEGFYSGSGDSSGENNNASSDDTVFLKYEDLGTNYNLAFRDIWPASKNSDGGYAIAIDETRKILYIVGTAAKPTSTCESSSYHNCWDLMVLRYDISVDPPQRLGDPWIWDDMGYNNIGFDVEIDNQGYLYIVGIGGANSVNSAFGPKNGFYFNYETGLYIHYSDIFVTKIDPQLFGSTTTSPVVWYQEYSSGPSSWHYDYSYSLVLDESLGRIYVVGYTEDRTSYYYDIHHRMHYDKDLIILRYDLDGNNLDGGTWITYNSNDEGLIIPDITFDGTLDSSGNLVVLARSGDFYRIKYGYPTCWPPKNDRIIKFDKNTGNIIFDKIYSTVYDDFFGGWDNDGEEIKGGIDLDSSGNQYFSGFFWDGRNYTIKNLKVSSTQPLLEWERNFGSWDRAANTPNYASGIKVDSQGNSYTIGYGNDSSRLTPEYWWIFKRSSDDNGYCGTYFVDNYNILWKKDTVNINLKGKPFGIDLDESENPVVCGVKTNGTTRDFAVVKFASSTGNVLWKQIYDTGNEDEARDVCVDDNGFIYVAGNTFNGTDYDWLLIKYDPSTTTIPWLMTYDSGGNDKVFGLTCQATSGIFYVTGFQDASGTKDLLTIKYDTNTTSSTSTILWKHLWDGGDEDVGYDLALDKDGYLYLAGKTNNSSNLDYLIIKYDTNSTTSPIVWQKTFDNPAGSDVSGDDYATGIAIDNFSSTTPLIYLAGTSYFEKDNPKRYDHTFNWIVIKLDANGNILANPWYDFATVRDDLVWKITKDNFDNFYFSGLSTVDCYTIIPSTYNWVDIKTDSSGNFNQVVVNNNTDIAILLDNEYFNNNVFSIRRKTGISWDFFLRKLDASNLNEVWSAQWGSQYNDFGMGIAVDSKINKHLIYFTGYSGNASGNNILRIGKLRKTDAHPWTLFTYNSSSEDKGVKLVVDSQGDLIVLGNKYSSTEWKWHLIKIHWTSTKPYYTLSFNTDIDFGDPNLEKYAYGIDLDENDDIYVVGTEIVDLGFTTTTRMRIAKFSGSDGSLIWTRMHGLGEEGYGIVVDKNPASEWLYIVGTKDWGANKALIVLRCKKDGSFCGEWQNYHIHSDQRGYDIALDSKGDVFVAGATKQMDWNYLILKWSSSSMPLSSPVGEKIYDAYGDDEFAKGIAIDALDRVVVTGTTYNPSTGHYEILTQKYENDLSGLPIWTVTYGESDKDYYAEDVACERGTKYDTIDERFMDFVYIAGYKYKPDSDDYDVYLMRYREYCSGPFPEETVFTDEDIFSTSSTSTFLIKSVHFKELRDVCDGLLKNSYYRYYNPSNRDSKIGFKASEVEPGQLIRAKHINGLRDALKEVYNQCGDIPPSFTDDPVTAGETLIRRIHIKELQDAAKVAK